MEVESVDGAFGAMEVMDVSQGATRKRCHGSNKHNLNGA